MSDKKRKQIKRGVGRHKRKVERANLRSGKIKAADEAQALMLCQVAEILEEGVAALDRIAKVAESVSSTDSPDFIWIQKG